MFYIYDCEVIRMIYYFTYQPITQDQTTYQAICDVIDRHGYLHEVEPKHLLVVPTCQIYNLRKALTPFLDENDRLEIIPITSGSFSDPEANDFVEFWRDARAPRCDYTLQALGHIV